MPSNTTKGVSKSFSDMDAYNKTNGKSLGHAIATIVNEAKSIARGSSTSIGKQTNKVNTKSKGGSRTDGTARTIANSLSIIKSYGEAIGASISKAIANSESETDTHTHSKSEGHTETSSESHAHSYGTSTRSEYYSIEDHSRMCSYLLGTLAKREAYVVKGTNKGVKIYTHDVSKFDTMLNGMDMTEDFLAKTRPEPVLIPTNSVFERLAAERLDKIERPTLPGGFE